MENESEIYFNEVPRCEISAQQGCQIVIDATYQNWENIPKNTIYSK
jgi:hypothetical protein